MSTFFEDNVDDVTGYDVVEEIGAVANQLQQRAAARGVPMAKSTAMQLAQRKLTLQAAQPRTAMRVPAIPGYGSGMSTQCGVGTATFAAASPAGAIVNLAARSEEPFVAHRIIIQRNDYAVAPPAGCAGIPISVLDVRIGQRSVLANAAGIPVEAFDPQATGGQWLSTGVVIARSTLITIQFAQGPVAIPAAEAVYCTVTLTGRE